MKTKLFGIGASAIVGLGALSLAALSPLETEACTRVLYHGSDSLYVVARSLDWKTPIPTNLYVYPAGMEKQSNNLPGAIEWTSRYGAVYAVSYDGGVTEGMNEKGLVINGLFCKGTVYTNKETEGRPPMSMSVFISWLLDNNATTDEVLDVLNKQDFTITAATFDNGTTTAIHWGVTDATGHSAIVEFENGEIRTYDMADYYAMTNDPAWPQMKAILNYWDKIGGTHMLPGTVSSPDRCVRANFFAHHVDKVSSTLEGMSIARSILVNSCVPYTYLIEGEPNVSSTQWRSYADVRDKLYGFELVTNPGYYWIDLKKCDLRPGARVMKLDTSKETTICGEANKYLEKSAPFNPIW